MTALMNTACLDVARAVPWFRAPRSASRLGELLAHAANAEAGGFLADAVEALEMAVELAPNDVEIRLRLAVHLAESGRTIEAQDAFIAVLDRDPTNLDALVSLGHLCRGARHLIGAIDLLEHARSIHGDHPDVLAALAHVAVDVEDLDGAMRLLVHLERRSPQHPDADPLVRRVAELRTRERLAALGC